MKKILILISFIIIVVSGAYAQAPDWTIDENEFEYSMSFVGFLNIDGINLASTNDMVGAFVNGEPRGYTNLIYVSTSDRYYAYLTVFASEDNEELSFKAYDSVNDQVVDLSQTISFEIGAHYGNLFQAFSFASPALNIEAEILNFEFANTTVSNNVYNDGEITLYVDNSTDVSSLNAVFQLSDGARMYIGTDLQESSNTNLDFSNPITFEVLSEDESVLKQWVVTVDFNSSIGDLRYFKKDAVCYNGGEIKVTSTINNVTAELSSSSNIIDSKIFNSGEVVFTGLDVGTYIVTVSGVQKEIIINLKE